MLTPDTPMESNVVAARIRVRYAETDQMQVAYYARYFEWFEVARSEFCRARGIDYAAMEASGLFMPIMEARCRYKAPARYDDELAIEVRPIEVRRRSVQFGYRITRGETLIAEGDTIQVLVSRDGKPRTFPPDILACFGPAAEP